MFYRYCMNFNFHWTSSNLYILNQEGKAYLVTFLRCRIITWLEKSICEYWCFELMTYFNRFENVKVLIQNVILLNAIPLELQRTCERFSIARKTWQMLWSTNTSISSSEICLAQKWMHFETIEEIECTSWTTDRQQGHARLWNKCG